AVLERLDAGRADLAVEHRQLAEDVARAECREGYRPAVGMLAGDAEAAGADDVAGVGMGALVEDAGRGRERAGDGDQGEALELALLEIREEWHAAQQLDRAGTPAGILHQRDYRHIGGQLAAAVSRRGPRAKPAWSSASSWPDPITGSPSSFSIESFGSR